MMRFKDWLAFAGWVALCEAAGIVGSLFTAPAIAGWYTTLARPALAPPNWVFAPVWATLFLLMGVAAFLVWKQHTHILKYVGMSLFAVQLALNVLWSFIFFGLHSPGAAFAEIILLWFTIAATLWVFAKISKPAAWLLSPYLAWVTFATYLNWMLWLLN